MKSRSDKPPRLAQKLLCWMLRDDLAEEVCGDLDEKFQVMLRKRSPVLAKLHYWYQLANYIRPFALRKTISVRLTPLFMLQNYARISIRTLFKQRVYALINTGGLAVGLAAFILIGLYIQHELSYDRFFTNGRQIYRIYQRQAGNEFLGSEYFGVTPAPLATVLMDELPEVTSATCFNSENSLVSFNDHHYWEQGLLADEHFFSVFPFQVLKGDPSNALRDKKTIVLTKSLAKKIFGDLDPIGQSLTYGDEDVFTVTAVMQDPPVNSSLQFSYLVNIRSREWAAAQLDKAKWSNNSFYTFFVLENGADPLALEKKLPKIQLAHRDPVDYANYPFKDEYIVQELSEIHFQANVNFDIGSKGNITYLYLFSAIAFLILMLACVNYMNLAVARSIGRMKEVGVRKTMGALRGQLIFQFLCDSVLITFVALIIAIGLTYLFLPFFSKLIDRDLTLDFLANSYLLPGLLLLILFVGLLSGSYPALVMSAQRPAQIMKANPDAKFSASWLQRVLIVGQFAVSLVLVICSLVIFNQLQFIQQKELGYNKDHVIVIHAKEHLGEQRIDALRHEWLQNPAVLAVSRSTQLPTNVRSSTIINDDAGSDTKDDIKIYECRADYDYLNVFGIKLVAGRNFSPEIRTDGDEGYILNETAAKALGWTPEEAIGKQFTHEGIETVIGVVKDFHMHSMHLAVQPLLITLRPEEGSSISVKVSPEKITETVSFLEQSFRKQSVYPFEYQFLDENFNQLYKADTRLGETFEFFTLLSMIIASLGLFGLAAFMAARRTKEIGIRKVLGASAGSIVMLLSGDFLKLVAIGFVISIPISWYSMHAWLESFAYRIDMKWWMFAIAGALAFVIANLTICYQSLRASRMDPVDSLRSE